MGCAGWRRWRLSLPAMSRPATQVRIGPSVFEPRSPKGGRVGMRVAALLRVPASSRGLCLPLATLFGVCPLITAAPASAGPFARLKAYSQYRSAMKRVNRALDERDPLTALRQASKARQLAGNNRFLNWRVNRAQRIANKTLWDPSRDHRPLFQRALRLLRRTGKQSSTWASSPKAAAGGRSRGLPWDPGRVTGTIRRAATLPWDPGRGSRGPSTEDYRLDPTGALYGDGHSHH
jgi:hypothetical protein